MQIRLLDTVVVGSKPFANLLYEIYGEILQLTWYLFCLCFDGRSVLIVALLYGGGWLVMVVAGRKEFLQLTGR
jgi:hypothetical protein